MLDDESDEEEDKQSNSGYSIRTRAFSFLCCFNSSCDLHLILLQGGGTGRAGEKEEKEEAPKEKEKVALGRSVLASIR